jgi:hypothetical protein
VRIAGREVVTRLTQVGERLVVGDRPVSELMDFRGAEPTSDEKID